MDSNKLYTYDRLSKFVQNYKEYVTKVESEEDNQQTTPYKYYHFEESPNGVTIRNLGNLNNESLSSIGDWKALPEKNGIDAWRMNLAKLYNQYKQKELAETLANRRSGLKYILKTTNGYFAPGVIPDDNDGNRPYNMSIEDTNSKSGDISDINQFFKTSLNQKVTELLGSDVTKDTKLISIDITGLVYVENGSYEYSFSRNGCNVDIWIGNDSICEFTSTNSSLNKNSNTFTKHYNLKQHVPIRIQCFFSTNIDSLTNLFQSLEFIFSMKYNGSLIESNKLPLFTNVKKPLLLYCAFVTENINDLNDDKFLCYSRFTIVNNEIVVNNHDNLSDFYSVIRKNLQFILAGEYDHNTDNRISYGDIPKINAKFTQFFSSNDPPFSYYLFVLDSDSRMGKTFQIKDDYKNSNDPYEMSEFSNTLSNSVLKYSDNYHEKTGYYPNSSSVGSEFLSNVHDITGTDCKDLCNSSTNCNHYFTYTSDKNPKCVTGSSIPYYNRVAPKNNEHPIDVNTSTLHLRNYKLDIGSDANCSGIKQKDKFIQNTYDYSDEFKYSKYTLTDTPIVTPKRLGACGDDEYIKHENDAANILYEDAKYFNNGEFKEAFGGLSQIRKYRQRQRQKQRQIQIKIQALQRQQQRQIQEQRQRQQQRQRQEQEQEQQRQQKQRPFKITHAISDTGNAINNNLQNGVQYGDKMKDIHNKHNLLEEKIPEMNKLYNYMKKEAIYDHKGDELLHFRTTAHPDVRKKRVMDNNELNNNTQLLLALGTVTSVTLIIFAIMLARD